MIKILFVCHGNICRSPMAEFVLRDLAAKDGLSDEIQTASAATSSEELGNPVHRGTRERLAREGISTQGKRAVRLRREDYAQYDYLLGMDRWNVQNMKRMTGGDPEGKIKLLLDFTNRPGEEIADPWYTGDFEATYRDVLEGCQGLIAHLKRSGRLPSQRAEGAQAPHKK